MVIENASQIELTLNQLFSEAKNDGFKIMKGFAKSLFRSIQPSDFSEVYLSITKEQGEDLVKLIKQNKLKNIVEFGTSFGISTLFLAQGVLESGGHIITTELIESKAQKALENFKKAGVNNLIELKVGDAMETLKTHAEPIDLLLLDGWKDLYLPLFEMLEPNFHAATLIYVDNAEMAETKAFLKEVSQKGKYQLQSKFGSKVVIISAKNQK